ncbi:16S rRNA (guanine(966)-N(2))-methyltransferase RsmD [Lachnospiraceae bacterium YH-ros2228]
MRVIAGKYRSRLLDTPKGMNTRPTTDRIKETLFNILSNRLPGASFLDLFAGSGQMAIEAISRGARYACLVDSSRDAQDCIRKNIERLGIEEETDLIGQDALSAIRTMPKQHFDLVFLDPPYRDEKEGEILSALAESELIDSESLIIIEADLHRDFRFAEELGFTIERIKKYKTNQHVFLSCQSGKTVE